MGNILELSLRYAGFSKQFEGRFADWLSKQYLLCQASLVDIEEPALVLKKTMRKAKELESGYAITCNRLIKETNAFRKFA
jgi:hypothetical protein